MPRPLQYSIFLVKPVLIKYLTLGMDLHVENTVIIAGITCCTRIVELYRLMLPRMMKFSVTVTGISNTAMEIRKCQYLYMCTRSNKSQAAMFRCVSHTHLICLPYQDEPFRRLM